MVLNTAQVHFNEMDDTYKDKPNNLEELHKVENDNEVSECKVCGKKFRK